MSRSWRRRLKGSTKSKKGEEEREREEKKGGKRVWRNQPWLKLTMFFLKSLRIREYKDNETQ